MASIDCKGIFLSSMFLRRDLDALSMLIRVSLNTVGAKRIQFVIPRASITMKPVRTYGITQGLLLGIAAKRPQQKLLILTHSIDGFDVATQAVTAGRIQKQFDVGFLAGLEQFAVNGNRVLE